MTYHSIAQHLVNTSVVKSVCVASFFEQGWEIDWNC